MDSLSLLQGIFPTKELNQGPLNCRWILYQLIKEAKYLDKDQIETIIENNQHYTKQGIANKLRISKSSAENRLYQLGYVNHFDVWVSHNLSEGLPW